MRFLVRLLPILTIALAAFALQPVHATGSGVGDDQADVVWGKSDFFSGVASETCPMQAASGPITLCLPGDALVDAQGNLWVGDGGDSRVLMYPYSASLGTPAPTPTLVLGQSDLYHALCNQSASSSSLPTASTLCWPPGLAMDANGTLFVGDSHNNRVLVYFHPLQKSNGAPADLVLGQSTFSGDAVNGNTGNGAQCPTITAGSVSQCTLNGPGGLAIDSRGDLLVTDDGNHRVLLFAASNFNPSNHVSCTSTCYIPAVQVWGQYGQFNTNVANNPTIPSTYQGVCSAIDSNHPASACTLDTPEGVAVDDHGDLFVSDSVNDRVLEYDTAVSATQPPSTRFYRQNATMVYGQSGSFTTNGCNGGPFTASHSALLPAGPDTLCTPIHLRFDAAGNLWVPDLDNCRVLEFPPPVTTNRTAATTPIAVLGQRGSFTSDGINDGGPATASGGIGPDAGSLAGPASVSFDAAGNLYVTDSVADFLDNPPNIEYNDRVLEYDEPYPISARIALGTGWNLVALPSQTSLPYSAAMIVNQVDEEGGSAAAVATYQSGAYHVFVPGYGPDFPVNATEGVFVLAQRSSIWGLT